MCGMRFHALKQYGEMVFYDSFLYLRGRGKVTHNA